MIGESDSASSAGGTGGEPARSAALDSFRSASVVAAKRLLPSWHLENAMKNEAYRRVAASVFDRVARLRRIPNPYRVYAADPADVDHVLTVPPGSEFDTSSGIEARFDEFRPRVVGGDWDRHRLRVSDTCLYEGFRQRFVDGVSWAETTLHPDRYAPSHSNCSTKYASMSEERFHEAASEHDALYDSLAETGCLPQSELPDGTFRNELALAIDRDGRLIRNNSGLHRLVCAQLLGLERIPVRVLVVHRDAPPEAGLPLEPVEPLEDVWP